MTPDFQRDVHCVLGLPFDAVSVEGATRKLRDAVRARRPCFLSTPNLNFVIVAQGDPVFRDSVLHSDLSVVDGTPLVWIARLLGIPLRERVAGSTIFERLRFGTGEPVKVFFFGAPDGVAAAACERLNASRSNLHCVGFDAPGFVSVEAMSEADRLQRINASGAEFVVVSLGARKGQAWIERNRHLLQAPVISHLGAVVNFVAGTVSRAPGWLQSAGLEWLWRIKEEPRLWRRYAQDGFTLIRLLLTRVLPHAIYARRSFPSTDEIANAHIEIEAVNEGVNIRLQGAWCRGNLACLRSALADAVQQDVACLDLAGVTHFDAAGVALLTLWCAHWARQGRQGIVGPVAPAVRRVIRYCCAEYLLEHPMPSQTFRSSVT